MMTDSWRIAILLFNRAGVGTYWRAHYFARSLAARGHRVTVVATAGKERLHRRERAEASFQLVEMPDLLPGALRSGWDPWNTLRRAAWLRGRSLDIVHAIECRPVVLGPALLAKRAGARLVMDWCDWFGRGGSVEERPNPFVRAALRPVETYLEEHFRGRADGTITINDFLARRAAALGVRRESIAVIRNGCEPALRPLGRRESRQATGLDTEAPLIGYVGNIYSRDAEFMAASLNCVRRSLPAARLVLAGYFNRQIEPLLDDPDAVIRTGPLPTLEEVHRYLSACNICWLPLRDSGANRGRWPGKLNDYMALARPVVATAVGDVAELVPQLGIGLVAPDEVQPFAAQTVSLLRDDERAASMGRVARQIAEGPFSWEHRIDELEAFYARVLQSRRG